MRKSLATALALVVLLPLIGQWAGAGTAPIRLSRVASLGGAAAQQVDSATTLTGAPLVLGADTLFYYQARLGPFSEADRAILVRRRLEQIVNNPQADFGRVEVVESENGLDLVAGEAILTTVTPADAAAAGRTLESLADERVAILDRALRGESIAARTRVIAIGLLLTLLTAATTFLIFRLVNRVFPRVFAAIEAGTTTWMPAVRLQKLELISAASVGAALLALARIVRIVVTVLLLYISIPIILSFFPWTRGYAEQLFGYVLTPFAAAGTAFLSYLPDLFTVGAIVVVTWYLLKLIRPIFIGLRRETITVGGFYPEWAMPTYQIVRVLVILFAFVAAWPYLPLSDSPAFQGVGVFVGLLLSIGSASAIGNMVGGIVITYMRPFRLGDRVKIADTVGDVIEKTLLVTRVRTPKNVDITIPNSMVLGSHIVNYSSSAKAPGLILHSTVTIGYDAPWRQVHELLLAAAAATPGLLPEPTPFVLQTALNDFYVAYELNAYTDQPRQMASTYSDLHSNIQDVFRDAGVEIMSPHYRAERDGNAPAIPAKPTG